MNVKYSDFWISYLIVATYWRPFVCSSLRCYRSNNADTCSMLSVSLWVSSSLSILFHLEHPSILWVSYSPLPFYYTANDFLRESVIAHPWHLPSPGSFFSRINSWIVIQAILFFIILYSSVRDACIEPSIILSTFLSNIVSLCSSVFLNVIV